MKSKRSAWTQDRFLLPSQRLIQPYIRKFEIPKVDSAFHSLGGSSRTDGCLFQMLQQTLAISFTTSLKGPTLYKETIQSRNRANILHGKINSAKIRQI